MTDPAVHPAATLIVMRDSANGPPGLLMVERAAAMAFAGGALVFPGGRVDPADIAMAETLGGDPDDTAARIAAIREAIEEAGVAIGIDPSPDAAAVRRLGAAIYGGTPIAEALGHDRRTIDPSALVAFARWRPEGIAHRVFDTRFYLARFPDDAPEPVVDGSENVRLFWASARDVLDDADAGNAALLYPTRRNLERLTQFASHAEAVADARRHPVRTITPWFEDREGDRFLCIPDDLGYPVTAERIDRVRRG